MRARVVRGTKGQGKTTPGTVREPALQRAFPVGGAYRRLFWLTKGALSLQRVLLAYKASPHKKRDVD